MSDWVVFGAGSLMLLMSLWFERSASKRQADAIEKIREATDAYKAAVREREEAYRILAHVEAVGIVREASVSQ